jgi:hypothetical protein
LIMGFGVKYTGMQDETVPAPEKTESETPTTDWAGLRAQADKLGITLSELQQREREKQLRLARKNQVRATPAGDGVPKQ